MRWIILLMLLACLVRPASAMELTAPQVPEAGAIWMPEDTSGFAQGFWELITRVTDALRPDLREASAIAVALVGISLLTGILQTMPGGGKGIPELAGAAVVVCLLLEGTGSLVSLGADTVQQISRYGKLLLPVMAAAMAAQGGVSASAGLYAGTALFDSLLITVLEGCILPGIWLYLALAAANSATGENLLKKGADLVKNLMSWLMKTLLMVFTTYLGITGVVSGTTDAAALKAARVTISSFVPVVGGVLSDASEAVLVSAGLMKNTAGIYGILAVLAIFLHPFLKIGVHYMILKVTGAVCAMFGVPRISELIDRFGTAMGFLLGMTGSCCVMVLVSTVCFLRGVGV